MTTPEIFLFVSHVSEDRAAAMEIVEELERRGLRCWIAPRDVTPGRPFDDEIAAAIDSSRAMLLIFSERCKRKRIYPSGGDGRGREPKGGDPLSHRECAAQARPARAALRFALARRVRFTRNGDRRVGQDVSQEKTEAVVEGTSDRAFQEREPPLVANSAAGRERRRQEGEAERRGPRTSASAPKPNPTAMPMRRKSPAGPGVKSRALDGRCRERRCWPHL